MYVNLANLNVLVLMLWMEMAVYQRFICVMDMPTAKMGMMNMGVTVSIQTQIDLNIISVLNTFLKAKNPT